jgi:hypothetical protein
MYPNIPFFSEEAVLGHLYIKIKFAGKMVIKNVIDKFI